MRIAIGSAGRRVYLVRWFKEALHKAGIPGDVYVFDSDDNASSIAVADGYQKLPPYSHDDYKIQLLDAIDNTQPDLFFSLNDYELLLLSDGLADNIRERQVIVPSLTKTMHRAVSDKYEMYRTLHEAAIPTPTTGILTNEDEVAKILKESESVILKDRVGSASSGLLRLTREEATAQIETGALHEHFESTGTPLESVIMQTEVPGEEYGLDLVSSPFGGTVQGVLARKKLRMRHGETSAAVTVSSESFAELGCDLGSLLGIKGLVDIDVIAHPNGDRVVIDINPRFGGGYPFNHMAGADVPTYYVSEISGREGDPNWNRYGTGVRSAKHEGIAVLGTTTIPR